MPTVSLFKDEASEEKGERARMSSFVGAMAIADLVKTTLGPKGMDKILQSTGRGNSVTVTTDAANYLASCMLPYAGADHLVFMPHNVGYHWVLVAINTKTESIYYMDSDENGKFSKNVKLRQLVEIGLRAFRTNRSGNNTKKAFNNFRWNTIQCPKQTDGIHCGYYIGCFIETILLGGETNIPVYLHANRLKTYPPNKMQSFRVNWVGYLYNRFIKEKMARNKEKMGRK